MAKNKFDWPKHEEFKVLAEDGSVVGTLRIKPNALLWAPKGANGAKPWFGVALEDFVQFAQDKGKKQAH